MDDGVLMARPFDLGSLAFDGEAVSLAEGVTQSVDSLWGGALFSVSTEGTLVFVRGASERRTISQLEWRDREGKVLGTVGEPQPYNQLRLSHDGRRAVTSIGDPGDLWMHDLERGTATRFTFDTGNDEQAHWSPDDTRVIFQSSRVIPGQPFSAGSLFQKLTSGLESEEYLPVTDQSATLMPTDWSPDGSAVALTAVRPKSGGDILIYSPEDGSVATYLATEHDEVLARFSPNGRWLAYEFDESGTSEVYVQAFPEPEGKWQVSVGGGRWPVWSADGRELFYLGAGRLMAVAVETEGGFRHDAPVRLFDVKTDGFFELSSSYDVAPDGKRFLFLSAVEEPEKDEAMVTLVRGWGEVARGVDAARR